MSVGDKQKPPPSPGWLRVGGLLLNLPITGHCLLPPPAPTEGLYFCHPIRDFASVSYLIASGLASA